MNSQPLTAARQATLAETELKPLPRQPRRAGPGWRLWDAWLWLTGPRPDRFGGGIAGQERLRRSRLLSALLVLIVISIPVLMPTTMVEALVWRPMAAVAIGGVLVALLNRGGLVTASGLAYIVLVDGAIAGYILTKPIFTYGNIPDLDLFILTILIGGMVLPRQLILVVATLHIGLILAIFNVTQHDSYLQAGIRDYFHNQQYSAIVDALLLQITGAGIAWLHAWSVSRAIRRADRAEELAAARAHIDEQARQIAEQKQRLEQGIQTIQEVQARVANGEYSARVSLQGNELLPLGVSFNILAERLSRIERVEQENQRLESALQQLYNACDKLARGVAPTSMRPTSTLADRIFPFLARLHQLVNQLIRGSDLAEDLRAVLQRQHEYLSEVENRLVKALTLTKNLADETVQALQRPPEARSSGSLSQPGERPSGSLNRPMERPSGALGTAAERPSGSLSQPGERSSGSLGAQESAGARAEVSARIKSLFDQQADLLEQARRRCTQASDLGTCCTLGARFLSQQLKEAG